MVQVRDLMKLPALKGVELVAGAGGDSRKVEHVTVMEVPDIKQWLKGNDLLITSFYSVRKSEEAQCRLIRELSDTCCCVAVKTGKYVDCISERVKRTADECGLPVFEIPFHIAYIDIIVSVMNLIFEDRGNSEILAKYVKDIIYENYSDEIMMTERGQLLGLDVRKDFFVAVTVFFRRDYSAPEQEKQSLRFLCQRLSKYLSGSVSVKQCCKIPFSEGHLLLLVGETQEMLSHHVRNGITESRIMERWEAGADKLCCAVGPVRKGIGGIRDSYRACFQAMNVGKILYPDQFLFFYERIRNFCALEDLLAEDRGQVFTGILKAVQGYELVNTLAVYYECGASLDKTAERMFTHKNTVKYRLNRLQEQTGLDLKNPGDNFQLYLAVLAMKMGKQ
ncbi:MAG: PucR family transcriptional regulator [Lachnospiraceae bacterium]|nr:PucR family transcriptional regulator [Lachnospiraceae bacterium]NBJ80395.1 PucR family transcriptional regulator [bacterium 1XD42-76]NBK03604.1 PucR family transcriptional regulator [bacterium 1XD42-94]